MKKQNIIRVAIIVMGALSISLMTNAQKPELDSLWNIWQDKDLSDTSRLNALSQIALQGFVYSKPDSAYLLAQMQYDLASSKGIKDQMARALNIQGISLHNQGDYIRARRFYQRSLSIYQELGDKVGIAGRLTNIGAIYRDQGNYLRALEFQQKSLRIFEELEDLNGIAIGLGNIGMIHFAQDNYSEALDYHHKSLEIKKELNNKREIAGTLINIGNIYYKQANDVKALEYYQRCLELFRELQIKRGIALALQNIGMTFHYHQANDTKALEYFQRSLEVHREMGNVAGRASVLKDIGNIHYKRGSFYLALEHCQESLELARNMGSLEQQMSAFECLYDNYKALGSGNKALECLEEIRVIQDSLKAEETTKKLQQMEFAKEVLQDSIDNAEKERLLQEAHEEEMLREENVRNWSIAGGFLALLLAGGFFSRWRYVRKSRDIISRERDRSENLLLNILPAEIAAELKEKGRAEARDYETVSIMFTDFQEFTRQSEKLTPAELVNEINECFEAFDGIAVKYGIEKIKTIGDAYMAAGGLPVPSDDSIKNTVLAALEMQRFIVDRRAKNMTEGKPAFQMRVGIHTGPVVAGIVGVKKFQYDIWGDTVNVASRMENCGEVGKVNISDATYQLIKNEPEFLFENRGKVGVKGKGEMNMYFARKKEVV